MILKIMITKDLIIQKHLTDGIKIYFKVNGKWYCRKLKVNDINCLIFGIHVLMNDYE